MMSSSSADHEEAAAAAAQLQKKYKGVRRRKWGKWVSEIRVPGTQGRLWLGSYATAEAAAVAHDIAFFCLRGTSTSAGNLNFPQCLPSGLRTDMSPRSVQKAASDAGMAIDAQLHSSQPPSAATATAAAAASDSAAHLHHLQYGSSSAGGGIGGADEIWGSGNFGQPHHQYQSNNYECGSETWEGCQYDHQYIMEESSHYSCREALNISVEDYL